MLSTRTKAAMVEVNTSRNLKLNSTAIKSYISVQTIKPVFMKFPSKQTHDEICNRRIQTMYSEQ